MHGSTRLRTPLVALSTLALLAAASSANAAPVLRKVVDQRGDFVLLGNTFGIDCSDGTPGKLIVGSVPAGAACLTGGGLGDLADSAPDYFFRSDDPTAGQVTARADITAAQARSTAMLATGTTPGAAIPSDAVVTYARLYWGASVATAAGAVKQTITMAREGGFSQLVTADDSVRKTVSNRLDWYQNTADVTALVVENGPGSYRLEGLDAASIVGVSDFLGMAGWSMVVLYSRPSDPVRNIALFDGLDIVKKGAFATASLSGFLVPPAPAGFDAKLGVVAYDGDSRDVGDSLLFGPVGRALVAGDALSDALNPANNFFNGSRSARGLPVSVVGDLPQANGLAGSFSGLDLDVVDISSKLARGATSAQFSATTGGGDPDFYGLGAFVTSISTLKPDFTASKKVVKNLTERPGGETLPGDTLEYTITLGNSGEDASAGTKITDVLPAGIAFVPGSVRVTDGANDGSKTDAAGDDQAEYVPGSRTLTVRLGTGASASAGGSIAKAGSATVQFRVTVEGTTLGEVSNSATISASGAAASGQGVTQPYTWPTGGDADATVVVDGCATDADCEEGTCDTNGTPNVCTTCTEATCDADNDNVTDADEVRLGTDPNNPDSDGDGWNDGIETNNGNGGKKIDSDGDGTIDALDKDSDNDCVPDSKEKTNAARIDPELPEFDANDNCDSGVCDVETGTCSKPVPMPVPEGDAGDGLLGIEALEGSGCTCNEAGGVGGAGGLGAASVAAFALGSVIRRRRRSA